MHASSNSYDEFIDDYKIISRVKSEKFYDLNKFINVGAKWFCETVCKIELPYSDKLNHRDFIHLYDFQKVFIHRFIIRIMELVKIKQHHYWNVDRQISTWKELNLNLEGVSFEAANIIINYPCTNEEFCICIRNICKYICVQISQDLEEFEIGKDITMPEDDSGSDYEDLHQIL
ncbi:uncharacterized protein LOC129567857 [Sitodiplosis mosellana]|uniref:uncharacterized protein LOC129567857 n=1 Tax=Sitodiplosis mosellana TaxID=263140 RepID=UPI0024440822|nr:uncharacterized protein LOC129567857 [Sitodiplosis mosellana]